MEYRARHKATHQPVVHSPAIYKAIFSYCDRTISNAQASLLLAEQDLATIEQKIAQRNTSHVIRQVSAIVYATLVGMIIAMITAAIEQYMLTLVCITAAVLAIAVSIWWSNPFLQHQDALRRRTRARAKLAAVQTSPFSDDERDEYAYAVELLLSANNISLETLCRAWAVRTIKADEIFMERYFELVNLLQQLDFMHQEDSVEKHRIRLQLQDAAVDAVSALRTA